MKRLILPIICVLPWLAGCSALDPDLTVPPAPDVVGVAAQNMALKEKVREGHGNQPDVFVPLSKAKAAVEAAKTQPELGTYAAGVLAQARAELKTAVKFWESTGDEQRTPSELRKVAIHAHSAKRLAQIAQYTAKREINLQQMSKTSSELDHVRQMQAQAQARRRAAQAAASASSGRQLIGKKVVPGPWGSFSFRQGTPVLKPKSIQVIMRLVGLLKQYPNVGVAILGYTSNSAPPDKALARFVQTNPQLQKKDLSHKQKVYAYNLALSNARARAVAKALVQAGIAARRIGARGFGSSRPVASNATAKGRAANNRVVAVIIPGPDNKNSPLQ